MRNEVLRLASSFVFIAASLLAADLPIRQVILFKHGVAYFERSGSILPGESARLDFKASEMNDVLKSLLINGKNEKVSGLRYDSSIPLDQKLAEFPFRIENGQPLSGVLDQLKGARIVLAMGSTPVAGAIVAARVVAADKDHAERQQIVLLVDSGEMRTFDLDAASSIAFTDAQLQGKFKDYLTALVAARSKEKRSVYIDGNTGGGRDVTAQYIIPAPVWKSSYRLILGATGEPELEGWAIVDNTTDEDWNSVQMSLVSGKPVSFVSELYKPKFIQRYGAELPEEEAVRAELHQGGVAGLPSPPAAMVMGASQTVSVNGAPVDLSGSSERISAGSGAGLGSGSYRRAAAPSSVVEQAAASEIADLFEYRIAQPVTIRKNESAMLPFLQDRIAARKVVIFNEDWGSDHPRNAAELTNSTAKTLDGGPITVFDGGSYAGEALMETLKAADKRLISYAVDLGTRMTTHYDTETREEREFHANHGVLWVKVATRKETTYTIRNVDARPKTLILEHAAQAEFKPVNQKPYELTDTLMRFEIPLKASGDSTFPLTEERVQQETVVISSQTPGILMQYLENLRLTGEGRKQIRQLLDMKNELASNQDEAARLKTRIQGFTDDEVRVRENLNSLNRVSGQQDLVQKYAAQLSQSETQIAAARDSERELSQKNGVLSGRINDFIQKMEF